MDQEFNLIALLRILGKWKKQILIATLGALLITAGVSLLMPNYYRSFTVLYASNPELAEPEPINGKEKNNKSFYGSDDDVDRLLSIATSNQLKRSLIQQFNLAEHYDIDISTGKGLERLYLKVDKLYKVTKTQYGAITISIEDTDKQLAKDMVTFIRLRLNDLAKSLIVNGQNNQIISKRALVKKQSDELNKLNDRIISVKNKYKLYDTESQSVVLAEIQSEVNSQLEGKVAKLGFYKSISGTSGKMNTLKSEIAALKKRKASIDKSIALLSEGATTLDQLETEFSTMNEEVIVEKEKLKKLELSEVQNYVPTIVVEEEEVAIVKSRPRRSLIVLAIGFLAFVLSCLVAVFIESTRSVDWKKIYAGE